MKKWQIDFRENVGYILSILVIVTYIGTSLMQITETGKTVSEILVDGFIILILGFTLTQTLGQQGMTDAENHRDVILAKREHRQAQDDVNLYLYKADQFCEYKNRMAIKSTRQRMLSANSMSYKDFFKDDNFIGEFLPKDKNRFQNKINKSKNKVLLKAVKIDITQISASDLIQESTKHNDPLARGRTKRQYIIQSSVMDSFMKVFTALAGGLYTANMVRGNQGEIIYRTVIAVILFAIGIVKYYANYRYVLNEFRGNIETSTSWLKEFKTMHDKGILANKEEIEYNVIEI